MAKVSRSALLSGAFHVRWPTIYSARYLSSFAYRFSGEHLSIIKRRYLFLSTYEAYGRSFIDFSGSPRAVMRRRISEKKSVTGRLRESFTNCRREIPIAPLSKGATGTRVRFSTWTGLYTRLWSENARSRRIAMTFRGVRRVVAVVGEAVVCGLLKNFTESPNKAEWRRGTIECSRITKKQKRERDSGREREKDRQKQEKRLWHNPRGEGFSLVPSRGC